MNNIRALVDEINQNIVGDIKISYYTPSVEEFKASTVLVARSETLESTPSSCGKTYSTIRLSITAISNTQLDFVDSDVLLDEISSVIMGNTLTGNHFYGIIELDRDSIGFTQNGNFVVTSAYVINTVS